MGGVNGDPAASSPTGADREPVWSPGAAAAPSAGVPQPPVAAAAVFGGRLAVAERFTALLADSGVSHGLVGPREVPRLWERHVLNCAVVHPAIPGGSEVIDVGSGAGLPGLALAIVRPDLHLHLVEPMLRRTTWLGDAVHALDLTNVTVHRGRAEQFWGRLSAPVVTARAVARLADLAGWCLPLLTAGGSMLALKGSSAAEELASDRAGLQRLGMVEDAIETYGDGLLDPPTTVVRLTIGPAVRGGGRPSRSAAKPGTRSGAGARAGGKDRSRSGSRRRGQ